PRCPQSSLPDALPSSPQVSADDGVARLVIGLRRGARAQCQRAGEYNLDESFSDDHVCSPYGGPPLRCGPACATHRPKPEIGYLENKLAPRIRVSPAGSDTGCIRCFRSGERRVGEEVRAVALQIRY